MIVKINPKFCEAIKNGIIEKLKNGNFTDKTEVAVLSHFSIYDESTWLLILIDNIPLIKTKVIRYDDYSSITERIFEELRKKYNISQ